MTGQTIFAFPTTDGYRFVPELGVETGAVLSRLAPDIIVQADAGVTLSPFVKVTWMGRFRFLPRNRLILIIGIVSAGINDEIHRGAYSVWATLRIVSMNQTPRTPLGRQEATEHLSQLLDDFRTEIAEGQRCKPFHDAFKMSVQSHATPTAIDAVLMQIESDIYAPNVFTNASYFSPAR